MSTTTLDTRIAALEKTLKRLVNLQAWQQTGQQLLQNISIKNRVWNAFRNEIRKSALDQMEELEKLRAELETATTAPELASAWQSYHQIYEESQSIFREWLEFLGGLAFRDKLLDESICQLADEIVDSLADTTLHEPTLTVPSAEEALTTTLGRIIRVRYPEGSIWMLPLIAHEYGHVLIAGMADMKQFRDQQATRWLAESTDLQTVADEDAERAQQYARAQISQFLADAFATYTSGPAYAFAAIYLRLNPFDTSQHPKRPTDAQRAEIILGMLAEMNAQSSGEPYSWVHKQLNDTWKQMRTPDAPPLTNATSYRALATTIWKKFNYEFVQAAYPATNIYDTNTGWPVANQWQAAWQTQLENYQPLEIPPNLTQSSRLRDALNAAWLCRLNNPDKIEQITRVTTTLCQRIIELHQNAPTIGRRSSLPGSQGVNRPPAATP